ncbi:MAG TPA: SDR family NAD(P)-dependent oxidoreductase [Polyangiales bacterium]
MTKSRRNTAIERVLIVGSSRGLGLDLARAYARRGAVVAICARDPDEVARAASELADTGARVLAEVCDATSADQVARMVANVEAQLGAIDLLITCAATIQVGPLECMTHADFEEAMRQIFWSAYHPTMAVLPGMRARRGGHIAHVTSFGGKLAVPHMLPYSSAKFAATGFSSGLRAEVAKDGIKVTTIAPGLLRTGAHVNAPFKGQRAKEYSWFSAGAVAPLLSLPSEKAAARIVRAIDRGVAEVTLSAGVRAAIILQAALPNAMAKLMALQNRFLPSAGGGSTEAQPGQEVARGSRSRWVRAIDRYGRANAERHHAYPGPQV